MTSPYDTYSSPLAARNASPQMLALWSPRHKFNTWRRIWLAVAEAQHEMGLPVTKEQVEELRAVVNRPGGITDEEMKAAEKYERELRHDVMAHVHALGDSCPKAKGIIHLGMTSQDVVCNADLLILRQASELIRAKQCSCVFAFSQRAFEWKSEPTLAFTHYQPAQPTTVGRRFASWAADVTDAIERYPRNLLRGLRGASGTQASYLALFDGRADLVEQLEARVIWQLVPACEIYNRLGAEVSLGFSVSESDTPFATDTLTKENANHVANLRQLAQKYRVPDENFIAHIDELEQLTVAELAQRKAGKIAKCLTWPCQGQTYPRSFDCERLAQLARTAAVLHKIATDIRLLCNRKEIDEPFEDKQIGSSAMPYKRNPMRCERICGLTRFVMNLVGNAYDTAATQWLERTLDDSSNRRLSLPEAFLALDGALDLMHNVASGLIVHEAMVRKNLMAELPFMATENILMECVKLGGDRQHYHELIRQHAQAAGLRVKQEGLENDLLDRLQRDPAFHPPALKTELDWSNLMDPMKYVGRSVEQTERFITEVVEPLRAQYGDAIAKLETSGPRV